MPGQSYQSSLYFPYAYQGQEKDAETGLLNFELRQYDARIGRWYNPDPMGQHHSPYLAMGNNPVSSVDADGGWDQDGSDNGITTGRQTEQMMANYNAKWVEEYFNSGSYHTTEQRMEGIGNYLSKLKKDGVTLEETKLHPDEYGVWEKGSTYSLGEGSDGSYVYSRDYGAKLTWHGLIDKESVSRYWNYQGGAANYFFSGVAEGVGESVAGTIKFLISDAYKAETWKGFAKTVYALALGSSEHQMLVQNLYNKIENADAHDWGNFTGQAAVAVVGTKGLGSTGIGVRINQEALKITAKVVSKVLNNGKNSVYIKSAGKVATRYDLLGKAHGGVPTPHKQLYKFNKNLVTGAENFSRASKTAHSMGWGDIGTVIWNLITN